MRRIILSLILLLGFCSGIYPIYFKHIGMQEGLSQLSVMAIYQDNLGRMWFGTEEGINIYDGVQTKVYKPSEFHRQNTNPIGNQTHFIAGDKDGNVFFDSDNSLIRYDIRTQKFSCLRKSNVYAVASIKGTIWVGIADSIFTWNPDKNEFDLVNYLQTKYFIDTLRELNMIPKQFIFISTLSVFGPVRERTYDPIMESDPPSPNTAYGLSKLKTELYLQSIPGFPYVIYRPTGVYGPREKDYYLMAKSIRQHTDFSVGFCRQDLTFVYVKDIVQAVFLGIEKQVSRRAYFLADGKVYSSRAFSDLIRKELGNPFVIRLRCPLIVLKVVSLLAEFWAKRQNKTSTLNSDKYRIMKQRNWQCDITPAVEELGFSPEYDLERGVKETIAWYKDKGWL